MKKLDDVNLVQEGDLLFYGGSLFVVSSFDFDRNIVNVKLENGTVIPKQVDGVKECTFFSSSEK